LRVMGKSESLFIRAIPYGEDDKHFSPRRAQGQGVRLMA
jgi:hypothetical protein